MTSHQVNHQLDKKADKELESTVGGVAMDVQGLKEGLQQIMQRMYNSEQQLGTSMSEMRRLSQSMRSLPVDGEGGGGGPVVQDDERVAGGEWKGLAGAMRMDAGGNAPQGGAVESGNFPLSERLQEHGSSTQQQMVQQQTTQSRPEPTLPMQQPISQQHSAAPAQAPQQQQQQQQQQTTGGYTEASGRDEPKYARPNPTQPAPTLTN
jgi:hypothetical protein